MLDLESWASGSIPTRGNIFHWIFLFSRNKAFDAIIGIIVNVVYLWKPRLAEKTTEGCAHLTTMSYPLHKRYTSQIAYKESVTCIK